MEAPVETRTAGSVPVSTPAYQVTWAGKDVSVTITPYVLSMTYIDHVHGESDELDLELEDIGGGWKDGWYPQKGDRLTVRIGYKGLPLMDCGDFEIEEFEVKGPPDTAHVRALATGVTKSLRTRNSKAYEGRSLRDIAQDIAARHGLTVVGDVPDTRFSRVTQNQERDLGFLKRVAEEYGQVFTVKGDQLIFMERSNLAERAPSVTLSRRDLKSYSLRDKGLTTFKQARACYDDPWEKTTHEGWAQGAGEDGIGDSIKLTRRAQGADHARMQAQAALDKANEARFEGTLEVVGNPALVAGNTVAVAGLGKLSGTYLVYSSRHKCSPGGGYTTEIEIRRGA